MKKIFAEFVMPLLITVLIVTLVGIILLYAFLYEDTHQDMIVIFLPDGQTIEGIGRITSSTYASVWVEIDGVKYKTGIDNVLVIRTP